MILLRIFTFTVLILGLACSISCVKPSPSVTTKKEEEPKDPNKLYPQELFFLDRNYPDFNIPGNLFQRRLTDAIRHDARNPSAHRGLDHPWTVQGPGNIGGRVNTIAVHPLNSLIIMLGFSQGGIYHSKDGGNTWRAVFDDQPSLSISDITFDVQNAGRVWATTGDVNISGYPFIGSGVYRSDNGGLNWTYKGLADKGVLSKVLVDPNDPTIIYVGSMGFPSHKGNEKGFFRSTDSGDTWEKTLTIDDSTGIIDMVVDPTQAGRVFATGWTRLRTNTYGTSVGTGTSVYRSDDYGATWVNLVDDLPGSAHSRTGVEIANDGTLYVTYVGKPTSGECAGGDENIRDIFTSHDGGNTWDSLSLRTAVEFPCGALAGFGWYFEALKVNPENAQDLFLLGVDLYRSLDGGQSWFEAAPQWWTYEVHADKHDLEFAAGKFYLATDGGAYRQPIDGSEDWEDFENIPATQFYRTTYNPHLPDQYFGGAQDNGTTGGNESMFNFWPRIFGGDGFQPLFDPNEPSWVYALIQNGNLWFSEDGFDFNHLNDGLYGQRYWDMPFVMSPFDSKILFAASHVVFKINMNDSIREWKPISPDLTKGDTILGNRHPAITSLAQSPVDEQRLYAGTQDGKLWTSPDRGDNWIDISNGTPDHYVTSITPSTIDAEKVYVTYSGYRNNDHSPYILRSDDAGQNWTSLGANFPMLGVNSFFILPEWNDEILFAATDGGVYTSLDGGTEWDRLGTNFPYMPVYDLDYNPFENTLVAATFARGLMTFPIEELDLTTAVDAVSQNTNFDKVVVYPTLAEDHFILDFNNYLGTEKEFSIAVFDISGQIVLTEKVDIRSRKQAQIMLSSKMTSGLYFIRVEHRSGSEIIGSVIKN